MASAPLIHFATHLRRHPFMVLLLMVLLSVMGGYGASKSQVDNSLPVWQSDDDPGWLAYQQFRERTQFADPLIILTPTTESGTLSKLCGSLRNLPNVTSCYAVEVETVQGAHDGLLSLTPVADADPAQLDGILQQVPAIFDRHGVKTFNLGGVWYLTNQLDKLSASSTSIFFPIVLAVVGLVVLFLCRSRTILVLGCGLLPALLLVGIMGLCGIKMNMVLLALPPLTLILGLAHAIHFSLKSWHNDDTTLTIFNKVAPPCTLSGLTTAMGFLSLRLSSYEPVRELGLWGAIGAVLSLAITFLLVPPFLQKETGKPRISLPETAGMALARNRSMILIVLALILVVAGFGVARLEKGSLILDFFSKNSAIRTNYEIIEDAGIGLTPMEIDLYQKPRTRESLETSLDELVRLYPQISHFLLTMTDQTQQVISLGAKMEVPEFSYPGQKVERITVLVETFSSEETLTMVDGVEAFLQTRLGSSSTPYVTGSVPLYTKGQKELFSSMLASFSGAFIAISLVIGLMLRSLKMAVIAMVPNLLPVLLVIAVMGWFSLPLSVATMTVASIIFGIVVDDTIHFLHSWQREEKGTSAIARIDHVFRQVGAPIITTTLVTGTGFLAFLAAPFVPLCHFGLLISLALWMALLCDLCILPVLLIGGDRV